MITRTPYPGNKIPASEQSALALQWMAFLPTPTSPGPYNNYLAQPVSDGILSNVNHYLGKIDHYWGDKDHIFVTIWRQKTHPNEQCALPVQLCTSSPANPEDAWVNRFNWDHIFSPTLLSHFAYGYLNRNEGYGSVSGQDPTKLPHIPNAAAYNASPAANFSGNGISNYPSWGNTQGFGPLNKSTRPSHIINELITWVHGAHTIKFGGEFRHLQEVFRNNNNQSGTVGFTRPLHRAAGRGERQPLRQPLGRRCRQRQPRTYTTSTSTVPSSAPTRLHVGDTWKMTIQADGQLRPALGPILAHV